MECYDVSSRAVVWCDSVAACSGCTRGAHAARAVGRLPAALGNYMTITLNIILNNSMSAEWLSG